MKYFVFITILWMAGSRVSAQVKYDSITISKFLIRDDLLGKNWKDTLKAGRYPAYLAGERTVWIKPVKVEKILPAIIALDNRIRANGTADVSKCFIPRHSINYYRGGSITRYMLVCFECDGVRFSDDPPGSFIRSVGTREKQMKELKEVFKDLL